MLSGSLVFILHSLLICSATLLFLRLGKEILIAWLALLTVSANLFVLKQTALFSLHVTCSDAYVVGYLLGLNLMQEYFGRAWARKTVWIALSISLAFLVFSQIHLAYPPSPYDTAHGHFLALLSPMPRIQAASLASFLAVQFLDIALFGLLKRKTSGKYLAARATLCMLITQTIDTLLFSFLGLYGLVHEIGHIIILSLVIKGALIFLAAPFLHLSKRIAPHAV